MVVPTDRDVTCINKLSPEKGDVSELSDQTVVVSGNVTLG